MMMIKLLRVLILKNVCRYARADYITQNTPTLLMRWTYHRI
jgi:hypothetical protein